MKNVNLLVTNIDDIKESIIRTFESDPDSPFKDYRYEGSGLNYLINILAYVTAYNNYYSAINVNEMYLPYAQKTQNIYAIARSLCYNVQRPVGAIAYIRPTLPEIYKPDTTKDIVVPLYSKIKSGRGLNYILMEEIRYKYNSSTLQYELYRNGVFEPTESPYYYKIKQGQFKYIRYTPSQAENQRLTINYTNIDNEKNSIIVQDAVDHDYWSAFYDVSDFNFDKSTERMLEASTTIDQLKNELVLNNSWNNFVLNLQTSTIFFVDVNNNNTYLTFGDNKLGKIPENPLDVFYILTEGDSGNGDTTFAFTGIFNYKRTDGSTGTINLKNLTLSLKDDVASYGGADQESISTTRNLAPSFYNTQNREVIEEDYETFLLQQTSIPLKNVKCIGGEKLKPIIMAGVGICANKATDNNDVKDSLLTEEEQVLLKFILKNQNVVTINPVFISPEFVKINVNAKVFFNPLKYTENQVYTLTNEAVRTYFLSINGFKTYFKSSNLSDIIDGLDEIDHNLLSADLEYTRKFTKTELSVNNYINFGYTNKIKVGSINNIPSTDYFLKIYNDNLYYDLLEYDETTDTGTFIPPTGTSNWDLSDYAGTVTIPPSTPPISNVHKIFLYDITEVETDNPEISNLVLVEKMPKQLKAVRIDGSDDAPFFFEYTNIVETGKRKIIGKINYSEGLIKLYLDEMSFKAMDSNKKSRKIAIETSAITSVLKSTLGTETIITYSNVDSTDNAYDTYEDLFFYDYEFNTTTNLPENQARTSKESFFFEFAFDTEEEDFKAEGNIILTQGDVNIERVSE